MKSSFCTGCGHREVSKLYKAHPLMDVPICWDCTNTYHSGAFTIENGNEIYCRWCGQGEGSLCLCDSCPKSFCTSCIFRNFGNSELERILRLSNRWSCFICSPQVIDDYIVRHNWRSITSSSDENQNNKPNKIPKTKADAVHDVFSLKGKVICYDITRGRENIEIPVINNIDNEPAPLDFVYVTSHVSGKDVTLTNNPEKMTCCTCVDNCSNIETCACLQIMNGASFDRDGILVVDKSATGVYECNSRCSCHMNSCRNRVVGKGPHVKLEVFRCPEKGKGWGVRCRTDIPPGCFIADYSGELIPERTADSRGLNYSDEYLFNLDFFGCQRACNMLTEVGIKRGLDAVTKEQDVDVSVLSEHHLLEIVGEEFAQVLSRSGAIARAQELGMQRLSGADVSDSNKISTSPTAHKSKSPIANRRIARPIPIPIQPMPTTSTSSASSSDMKTTHNNKSWYDINHQARLRAWRRARSILSDRVILSTESEYSTYTVDAKSFGSIGRFFNHSCEPNMDKVTVFTDSHDPRTARVAFFSAESIPAYSELCYDYGYQAGNVDGKHRECLCGTPSCRKVWY